jgi:hypothetical protein
VTRSIAAQLNGNSVARAGAGQMAMSKTRAKKK